MSNEASSSSDSHSRGAWLALPAAFWLVVFFLIPLLIVLAVSFYTRGEHAKLTFPLTLENYKYVTEGGYWSVLIRSFLIAFRTTAICLILGYPLAFFIASRRNNSVRQVMLFLVVLPFWTNFLIRTYAWRVILAKEGFLNHWLIQLGVTDEPVEILLTQKAVILGMVYGFLPFMVLPIYAAMVRFNFRLVEAGYDLGGNDWTVFRRVIFPLTLPGVIAGSILVFIPAIGSYVTPDMLGGVQGRMIGNLIERNFRGTGHWPRGAATSMVLMGIVLAGLILYVIFVERNTYQAGKRRPTQTTTTPLSPTTEKAFSGVSALLSVATGFGVLRNTTRGIFDKLYDLRLRLWLTPEQQWMRDRFLRRVGSLVLYINPIFCYIFLWLPIIVLVVFSFNDSKSTATWQGFTTRWYDHIMNNVIGDGDSKFSTTLMLQTFKNSLIIALSATILATIVGTMVALSLARTRHVGQRPLIGLLYLPVAIPEIAQGISLLIFFNRSFTLIDNVWRALPVTFLMATDAWGDLPWQVWHTVAALVPGAVLVKPLLYEIFDLWVALFGTGGTGLKFGFSTMIVAHVAFNIPYITIVVQARLAGMSQTVEEAARDLGANNWGTFWRVTFPLALPGIIAGALLAFTLSLDDYVVSFFTAGIGTTTLTMFVYGLLKQTITPEINAISTLMIIGSTILVALSLVMQGRSASES